MDTPLVSIESNIAIEVVRDRDNGQITTFLAPGGDISLGPNGGFVQWMKRLFSDSNWHGSPFNKSVSPYVAIIHNVDDVVNDYSGPFLYETTTAAYKYGGTWGEAYSPGDSPNPSDRQGAYSEVYGGTLGYALTTNQGISHYIPVMTHNPGQIIPEEIHIVDYLMKIIFGE